jgi:hypothetical protein
VRDEDRRQHRQRDDPDDVEREQRVTWKPESP